MKKAFLALGVIALASFVSCQGEKTPDPTSGIKFTSEDVIDIADGNFATIEFKAYEDWTAEAIAVDGAALKDVTLSATGGAAGDWKLKVTVPSLGEGEVGRTIVVKINYASDFDFAVVLQGKAFACFAYDTAPAAGGDAKIAIASNCTFTMSNPEASWLTTKLTQAANKLSYVLDVTYAANDSYDSRKGSVTVTIPAIQVAVYDGEGNPTGETTDYVGTLYFSQYGLATLAFSKSLEDYGVSTLSNVGALHHLGVKDGKIVVSDGTSFHALNSDGTYNAGSACPIAGVAPESMAIDAKGNMLFAQSGPYCGTFDIYLATGAADPVKFISYNHNAVYSNMVSNLRVFGDVTADAVITALTDLYPYCVYWEVKAGVPGEAKLTALPSGANWDTWSGIIWNANRNGCVAPLGTSADAGFLFIAYDSLYTLYFVDKDGNSQPLFAYEDYFGAGAGSNVNFQCISVREWNGKTYAAIGVSTYFSWGGCPDVILVNVTDKEIVANIDHNTFGITCTYIGVNDGENASADVCLIPEDDQLGVVMIDGLNDVIYRVNCPKK